MQLARKRILVVDPSRTIQVLLRDYIGNAGHRSTPQEAYKAFTGLRQAPDVVFLALDHAEELYKVITYMKEQRAYSHTRVVAMVLAEEQAAIQRTLGTSRIHYLVKPFHIQQALALVNNGRL